MEKKFCVSSVKNDDLKLIREAASKDGRNTSQFMRYYSLQAARQILQLE